MNKLYSSILLSTLLTACGGGGGSESNTQQAPAGVSQPDNTPPTPVQNQPEVTELSLVEVNPVEAGEVIESPAQSTHDIAVPDGFALTSERSFNFMVARSVDDNQAAYLSLCSDYQQHDDGNYGINYNSCLLRTSLTDVNYETVITVTNDTKGLVAALWFMDGNKEPIMVDWHF
jgi:hypothetical protein